MQKQINFELIFSNFLFSTSMDGESGCMRVERLENHSIALFELSMTLRCI